MGLQIVKETNKKQVAVSFFNEAAWHSYNL